MKKFILLVLMISFCSSVMAKDNTSPLLKQISKDKNLRKAVKVMNNPVSSSSYKAILGENSSNDIIYISFEDLSKRNKQYSEFSALGLVKKGKLYIYVNKNHKKDNIYTLSALISGMAVHIDSETSINEEIYAFSKEGATWGYYLKTIPKLKNLNTTKLTERENFLYSEYSKSPQNANYIRDIIETNDAYSNYNKTSKDFTNEELNTKLKSLYEKYSETGYMTGF